jgi:uncharacterized protein (DUF1697 family)
MQIYVALLRGVNVGGKAMIKMAELAEVLTAAELCDVKTYIQSGNVIFRSELSSDQLAREVSQTIEARFQLPVEVAVYSLPEWKKIIAAAPTWWGKDPAWKHNLLVLLKPYRMSDVVQSIGILKPGIEAMQPGNGVIYQSMSRDVFGKTTTGKLASSPIYKRITIRNYNTSTKLLSLLEALDTK